MDLLKTFDSSVGFEPWSPCMKATALTISTTETWLTVSLNQRHLLITKALRATSTIGWLCHLFVVASCQPQLLIAMCTKSWWFCHVSSIYLYSEKTPYLYQSDQLPPLRCEETSYRMPVGPIDKDVNQLKKKTSEINYQLYCCIAQLRVCIMVRREG